MKGRKTPQRTKTPAGARRPAVPRSSAHQQLEARFQAVFENSRDAIGVSKEGTHVLVNPAYLALFGFPEGTDLAGVPILDLIAPGSREQITEYIRRRGRGEAVPWSYETRGLRDDGAEFDMEVNASAYEEDGETLTLVILRDISERKQSERKLQEGESALRTAQQIARIGTWRYEIAENRIWWSEELFRIFGVPPEAGPLTPEILYARLHPDDREIFRTQVATRESRRADYRIVMPGGTIKHIHEEVRVDRDAQGAPVRMYGTAQDVTERKEAEEALRERDAKYRLLFESAKDGIFIYDESGFRDCNQKGAEMYGLPREQLIGRHPGEFTRERQPDGRLSAEVIREKVAGAMSGIPQVFQWQPTRADGATFDVEITLSMLELGGKPCLQAIVRDIGERKRSEEALRESEEKFSRIFEKAPLLVTLSDVQTGRFIEVNEKFLEISGHRREDVIGKTPVEIGWVSEEDRSRVYQTLCAQGRVAGMEFTLHGKDGGRVICLYSGELITVKGAQCLLSIAQDITERKKAEAELERQKAILQQVFDTSNVGIGLVDRRGRFTLANRRMAEMFGRSMEEFIGSNYVDHVYQADQEKSRRNLTALLDGEIPATEIERPYVRKDGSPFWGHLAAKRFLDARGGVIGVVGVITDITERKRAEEKIGKYSHDLQRLLAVSREMTATTDVSRLYRTAVQTAVDLLRFDYSTIMALSEDKHGLTIMDTLGFPRSMVGTFTLVEGQGLSTYVVRNRRPDAVVDFNEETRFAVPAVVRKEGIRSALCVPMMLGDDIFGVLIGHSRSQREFTPEDVAIYENIGNEAAIAIRNAINLDEIRRAAETLRNITASIAEGLYVLDETGRIAFMNEEAGRLLGWTADELNDRGAHELIHFRKADGTPLPQEACRMHGSALRRTRYASNDEVFVRKDGTVFPISVVCSPIVGENGVAGSVVAFRDITETKRLEQELLKIQKLESVGTLAGGIAHDFNNLLQGVFGYISMAKLALGDRERAAAMLQQAEKALHQAVNLTNQLLTFSKGGKPVRTFMTLGPVIENSVRFALSGSQVSYRIDLARDLLPVEADEGQIGQVIHNIVLNADQAMPLGGTISIAASNVSPSSPELPAGLADTTHVRISVKDSGAGIPAEYLPRIFDPYFTTKEKGSGLGLATSYAIIRNHGGVITVASEPGRGSTFEVFLPASRSRAEAEQSAGIKAAGKRGRVLIMDDEAVVRDVASELVRELGHEAVCAEHGAAALEAYRKARDAGRPFDVVILDLTIRGGMGGLEAVRGLRAIDPAVRAVMSSGYSDDAVSSDFLQQGFNAVLKKPYDIDALRAVLNELLA